MKTIIFLLIRLVFLVLFSFFVSIPAFSFVKQVKPKYKNKVVIYYLKGGRKKATLKGISDSSIFINKRRHTEIYAKDIKRLKIFRSYHGIIGKSIGIGTSAGLLIGYATYTPDTSPGFKALNFTREETAILSGVFLGLVSIPVGITIKKLQKRTKTYIINGDVQSFKYHSSNILINIL